MIRRSNGWCCPAFESRFEEAGSRGFAVVVAEGGSGEARFLLQHRAVEPGDESRVDASAPLSLLSELQMRHCPWCGKGLEEWYADRWRTMIKPEISVIRIPELDG